MPAKEFATLPLRKRIQMVFQDPTDSLNPRYTAARAIADPILRSATSRGATPCVRAARNWPRKSDCRSNSSTAFHISCLAARRRVSA